MNFEYKLDKNLRVVPTNPEVLQKKLAEAREQLKITNDTIDRVSLMGEMASYMTFLGELNEAELLLTKALELISSSKVGVQREMQQKLRLAQVYNYREDYERSNKLFNEVVHICETDPSAKSMLHFAYQHAGKNLFNQKKYEAAFEFFNKALDIRVSTGAPNDQLESTRQAIKACLSKSDKLKRN